MLDIINKTKNKNILFSYLQRPQKNFVEQQALVQKIFQDVKKNKNKAIENYTLTYDKVIIKKCLVSKKEINEGIKNTPKSLKDSIKVAYDNIYKFHKAQLSNEKKINIVDGITCWRETRAIEKIGIYIPGGTAPLFSSVLMLAIPARIAGCKEIVITTPPNLQGIINNAILYAANLVGIKKVFKCGGIQAIAGLTFGTEEIPRVYKIVGPGNSYVTAAKIEAIKHGVAIDMPAGPSELMIIADESINPAWVAADVLAQLEHGIDSQVIVVSENLALAKKINLAIEAQINQMKRKEIVLQSLKNSNIIVEPVLQKQIAIINEYAPEHLSLLCKNYKTYIPFIENAGSIFLGEYSAEAMGDYASGTNHTLPTNGNAKAYGGVSVETFIKKITLQEINKKGLRNIGKSVALMAEHEQLFAHQNSILIRM